MPKTVTSYSLLISCPSDVSEFLPIIQEGIASFNRDFGKQNNLIISSIHYSTDVYSNISKDGSPQGEINRQVFDDLDPDFLLGIFWKRFGQPTLKYDSGTEEEINIMLEKGKPVILYFLDKLVRPSEIDTEQLNKINAFKEKYKNKGIYQVLNGETELGLKIRDELSLRFQRILKATKKADSASSQERSSPQEKTILWVDDRPENNLSGRKYFQSIGIEVIPALSTGQALRYLANNSVSVIISDMERKEGPREGYVLLDKLREKGDNTPFIIYAGSRAREHIEETKRHGGQGCTNNLMELFEMVSSILLGSFTGQDTSTEY